MRIDLVITDMWAGDHRPMRMQRTHGCPISVVGPIPADVARPEGRCATQVTAATPTVTMTAVGAGDDLMDAQHIAEGKLIRATMDAFGPIDLEWPIARLQAAWNYRALLLSALRFGRAA